MQNLGIPRTFPIHKGNIKTNMDIFHDICIVIAISFFLFLSVIQWTNKSMLIHLTSLQFNQDTLFILYCCIFKPALIIL